MIIKGNDLLVTGKMSEQPFRDQEAMSIPQQRALG
jgi:hypothetical protein